MVGGLLSGGDAHSVFLRDFANTNNNTVTLNSNIVISGGGGRVGLWDRYIYILLTGIVGSVYIYILYHYQNKCEYSLNTTKVTWHKYWDSKNNTPVSDSKFVCTILLNYLYYSNSE